MYSVTDDCSSNSRVSPFGDLRVIMPVCGSPKLIAAYHVLLRLSVPRHPSCALISLTTKKLDKVVLIRRRTTEKLYVDITQFFNYQRTPDAQASCIINGKPFRIIYHIPFKGLAFIFNRMKMVGVPGFEPGTSSLSGTRSNQLSYTPN